MSKPLGATATSAGPPPFWAQLPMVFKYPAHGDALVKIAAFTIALVVADRFLPLAWLWMALIWLAFLGYCFRTLERTALGHLVPAEFTTEDRTNRDYRPILQVVIFIIFMGIAIATGAFLGPVMGQVALFVVSLVIPASIMVLALDERLGSALNPARLLETIAGIGLPYFALCVFLLLLLESSQFLSDGLDAFMPDWLSEILADVVTMYFMVSMYYLMGYALFQNHEKLGIDVQVDAAKAHQNLRSSAGAAPDLLGPETTGLISEGKLEDAAGRIENRLKREYDNNKLHDQYHKLLLLDGKPKPIVRHVNEYVANPDLALADPALVLPLATQAAELRRDATAIELVKGFDKRFPDHADVPGVYLLAAKLLLEKHHDYAMAQKICKHLQSKFPQHPLAAEAQKVGELAAKMAAAAPAGAK